MKECDYIREKIDFKISTEELDSIFKCVEKQFLGEVASLQKIIEQKDEIIRNLTGSD